MTAYCPACVCHVEVSVLAAVVEPWGTKFVPERRFCARCGYYLSSTGGERL